MEEEKGEEGASPPQFCRLYVSMPNFMGFDTLTGQIVFVSKSKLLLGM